jgi:hypothetical protein
LEKYYEIAERSGVACIVVRRNSNVEGMARANAVGKTGAYGLLIVPRLVDQAHDLHAVHHFHELFDLFGVHWYAHERAGFERCE